ncbi:DNA-binding protein [Chamaesiphon sp. GL140_3_metabinner_50]|uniref:DNA-binding protein n=1 Tax=Chamaesiphon sp. GL140_3_metabinner_50 TaxID=2970812 RepID=UPI0025EA8D6F|nr:DNA-binding protein [Chamaesiphon sp. GL140_3_metabinner_50]
MQEYSFTLKFNFQDASTDPNSYIEKLYEGGCDDALIGVGKQGSIALDFMREAPSAFEAISGAITNVKKVIPTAILIEASPDFVGLTDIADIIGCTRQNIRNVIVNDRSRSPLPVYEGTPSIWHLSEVLTWLKEDKTYTIDEALLEVSRINMNFNIARNWRKIEPMLQENIKALVA